MNRLFLNTCILLSGIAATAGGIAHAESWKILKGDSSRADLFYKIVQDKAREDNLPVPSDQDARDFALTREFLFPTDAQTDKSTGKARQNSIFLVDISHYTDPSIRLDQLSAQQVRGVYAKATQGVMSKDKLFATYWSRLGALKGKQPPLYRGAYHFLSSTGSGADQAKTFLLLLKENGGLKADDLPPVVDLEWDVSKGKPGDAWSRRSPDEILASVKAWAEAVKTATGKTPMIYTARSWWRERIGSEKRIAELSAYKIWIADYSKSAQAIEVPSVPNKAAAALWQFTDNSKLGSGYSKALDANIYKGSEDDFLKDFQLK